MQDTLTFPIQKDDVIAFLKRNEDNNWYCCSVDHWIMNYWQGYANAEVSSIEGAFYNYISQYKISTDALKAFFRKQVDANDYWGIRDNLPCVYINFDQRLFLSTFYDIPLENRVLDSWTGKYTPFHDLIPQEKKYWIIDGKDWMEEILKT